MRSVRWDRTDKVTNYGRILTSRKRSGAAPSSGIDGDTLRMVIANPPFLPGLEWRTILKRIE